MEACWHVPPTLNAQGKNTFAGEKRQAEGLQRVNAWDLWKRNICFKHEAVWLGWLVEINMEIRNLYRNLFPELLTWGNTHRINFVWFCLHQRIRDKMRQLQIIYVASSTM